MTLAIKQQPVTDDLKRFMIEGFRQHAMTKTGMDGKKDDPVSFVSYDGKVVAGAVVAEIFWGQLHIKNVIVGEKYRGGGIATELMERAHTYGRKQGCNFAYVETLSFQAAGFYERLGYKKDFERPGYLGDVSFIYMRKDLDA